MNTNLFGSFAQLVFPVVTEPVEFEDSVPFSIKDEKFDLIYPAKIRKLSPVFWTPVAVAAEAARWLAAKPDVRVLDIGSGPGKFCLVAASLSEGHFTGVEMRSDLVAIAQQAATDLKLPGIEFIHGNVLEVGFGAYMGYANDIPSCYSCEATRFGDDLKLWIKQREYDPDLESFKVSRSYHGAAGWGPPACLKDFWRMRFQLTLETRRLCRSLSRCFSSSR
jgi:SAM-dependent methyltransferase